MGYVFPKKVLLGSTEVRGIGVLRGLLWELYDCSTRASGVLRVLRIGVVPEVRDVRAKGEGHC